MPFLGAGALRCQSSGAARGASEWAGKARTTWSDLTRISGSHDNNSVRRLETEE